MTEKKTCTKLQNLTNLEVSKVFKQIGQEKMSESRAQEKQRLFIEISRAVIGSKKTSERSSLVHYL